MVPFGKVFARKPEDWFSGSLLSSFAVSRFGKKRKTPEKPWNILSGPSWATLPDHSSAQNYQLRKCLAHGKIGSHLFILLAGRVARSLQCLNQSHCFFLSLLECS